MKLIVMGVTLNQGEYEGTKYDYCTVQGIARMDASKGTKKGHAGIEYRAPSSLWPILEKLPLDEGGRPGVAYDVEVETVAGRRGATTQELVSIRPIKAV